MRNPTFAYLTRTPSTIPYRCVQVQIKQLSRRVIELLCLCFVLQLWSLRAEALQRLGLFHLLAQELSSVFALLPRPWTLSQPPFVHPSMPFQLAFTYASLQGYLGKPTLSIDALLELLQACKLELKDALAQGRPIQAWEHRLKSVGEALVDVLVDDKVSARHSCDAPAYRK